MSAVFRKLAGDRGGGKVSRLPRQTLMNIQFAGIVRMSAQNNTTHWLSVMESTVLRFLSRYGIYFQKTGPVVDYHGRRQSAVACIDSALSGIYAHRRDAWEIITDFGNVWPLSRNAKHFVYSQG